MTKQNLNNIIIITAAGNSSWAREHLSPSSWVRMFGEGLIGDYKTKMNMLRVVDEKIASWLGNLNSLVKNMESALASNRLVDLAILLGELNQKLKNTVLAGKEVEKVHQQALDKFDEESNNHLPEDLSGKLAQAGWWSDLKRKYVSNKFDDDYREKRKLALRKLVDLSRETVNNVNLSLRDLGKARASGNLGNYINVLRDISIEQKRFHSIFFPIYIQYLEPVVKRIEEKRKEEKSLAQSLIQNEKQELTPETVKEVSIPDLETSKSTLEKTIADEPTTLEIAPEEDNRPTLLDVPNLEVPEYVAPIQNEIPKLVEEQVIVKEPKQRKKKEPTIKEEIKQIKEPSVPKPRPSRAKKPQGFQPATAPSPNEPTLINEPVKNAWLKVVNTKFYDDLKTASIENNPYLLGWMMVKHAELIANVDEKQSSELFDMAEKILNEQ